VEAHCDVLVTRNQVKCSRSQSRAFRARDVAPEFLILRQRAAVMIAAHRRCDFRDAPIAAKIS
jgi:hypothetical protein